METHVINAGDGQGQHPTQALLDLLTIYRVFGDHWQGLKVSIVGDIKRSRVANSLISALQIMGVENINLVAPKALLPTKNDSPNVQMHHSLDEGVQGSDVLIALRIQHERAGVEEFSEQEYKDSFRIGDKTLGLLKPESIIMHPGPVNYGVEITKEAALSHQSQILDQVSHGVLIRAAVLEAVC